MKAINNIPAPEENEESAGISYYIFSGLLLFSAVLFIGYLIYLFIS